MYAVLPTGSKPSKSASKDQTRPVLTHGVLRHADDGWELVTCDSYQLARVKLSVHEDEGPELTEGPISTDALKAIEKAGGFYANGSVEPCDAYGRKTGLTFARSMDVGQFPKWDQLMPEHTGDEFAIGLDAELLYQLAQSLGAKDRSKASVKITFTTVDGKPSALKPMVVTALGRNAVEGCGLLMPVRIDA